MEKTQEHTHFCDILVILRPWKLNSAVLRSQGMVINTQFCQSILVGCFQINSGCFTILNCPTKCDHAIYYWRYCYQKYFYYSVSAKWLGIIQKEKLAITDGKQNTHFNNNGRLCTKIYYCNIHTRTDHGNLWKKNCTI